MDVESPRRESDEDDSDEDMGIVKKGMEHIILADLGINEEDLEVESDDVIDDDDDENNNKSSNDVTGAGTHYNKQVEVD